MDKQITGYELDVLLFYAFRYALGRMTYAVADVADLLIKYKSSLSKNHVYLIKREITTAFAERRAGMSMDIREWQQVMEELEKPVEYKE